MAAPIGSAARTGQVVTPARQGVGSPVYPGVDQPTPGSSGAQVAWPDVQNVTVSPPITVAAGSNTIGHATSGVTAGTYGDATHIPQVTVEADGHITTILNVLAPYMPLAGGTFTGNVTVNGLLYTVVLVNDTSYTLTGNENIIIWTAISAVRFVTIPTGLPVGQFIQVIDGSNQIVTGSKEIQLSVNAGVTANGSTGCCFTFINNPQGTGMLVVRAANTLNYFGNSWPLWLSSSALVTYNGNATLGGNWIFKAVSGAALLVQSGSSLGMQVQAQTISGTLTLANASSNFQAINGGAADRIVNFPFTNGQFYWFWNTGTTNNLLLTTNSALVYSLPPGQSVLIAYNGAAFMVWSGTGPYFQRKVDLTAQAAAQSGTALLTTASNGSGMYRISYAAVITQAGTVSSTLGGFSVTFTDNDTGASVTTPVGPTSTANTIGTQLDGTVLVNAKVSTAITISFGYASSGATAMQYALHVRSEFLG